MTIPWRFLLAVVLLSTAGTTTALGDPLVRMQTNAGEIVMLLDREKAPKTVANFVQYASDGFYDGTIFHRVIDGFMIQGGGYDMDYGKKETRDAIPNEADNGLENTKGTVAMARTRDPHSATAQFFINVADNDFLNHRGKTSRGWGYAVFGRVVEGMEVVEQIGRMPTGPGGPFPKDVPQSVVVIEKVTVEQGSS
jgi:cyclophilin family peptidyl-prolyl cis-trans isomerase